VLKLTVPDIYQGGELWDFSLVDPDNRRLRRPASRARRTNGERGCTGRRACLGLAPSDRLTQDEIEHIRL
jgi:hypothetical protein